jgi:hypothetical protein
MAKPIEVAEWQIHAGQFFVKDTKGRLWDVQYKPGQPYQPSDWVEIPLPDDPDDRGNA